MMEFEKRVVIDDDESKKDDATVKRELLDVDDRKHWINPSLPFDSKVFF